MLTPLESAVLDTMLDTPGEPYETLRRQLSYATVSRRELTGVGFFTEFDLPAAAPVARNLPDMTIGDVGAEMPDLEHGAGFVLFVRAGAAAMLEGYTYDEKWPEKTETFRLFKMRSD
jgi:hypothetical protein